MIKKKPDNTFSGTDLIRFYEFYLTITEQIEVWEYFRLEEDPSITSGRRDAVDAMLGDAFKLGEKILAQLMIWAAGGDPDVEGILDICTRTYNLFKDYRRFQAKYGDVK